MTKTTGLLRWGANFTALSAGLHVLAPIISGFSGDAVPLLIAGVVYAAFAYGLYQGRRWLAYVVFLVLLMGTSVAVSGIWASGDVPGWLFGGIAVANLLAVAALFGALWKSAPQTGAP